MKKILGLLLSTVCISSYALSINSCNQMLNQTEAGQAGCVFNTYAVSGAGDIYCNFHWTCPNVNTNLMSASCQPGGFGLFDCKKLYYCPKSYTGLGTGPICQR